MGWRSCWKGNSSLKRVCYTGGSKFSPILPFVSALIVRIRSSHRIGFMNLAGFVARTKYYAVWCMASVEFSRSFLVPRSSLSSDSYRETAFIVAGLGYNPQTKHYDASRNVRIGSIELAPNFKVSSERSFTSSPTRAELVVFTDSQILLDSWNMNTNVWLRECIYKRVAKTGKKPG